MFLSIVVCYRSEYFLLQLYLALHLSCLFLSSSSIALLPVVSDVSNTIFIEYVHVLAFLIISSQVGYIISCLVVRNLIAFGDSKQYVHESLDNQVRLKIFAALRNKVLHNIWHTAQYDDIYSSFDGDIQYIAFH